MNNMTTTKQTFYICNDCGNFILYHELIKKKTITINKTETRYQHSCTICKNTSFKIISIVISK